MNNSQWSFGYATGTANTPWTPNQNPANTVQMLTTATHSQTGGSQIFEYESSGELKKVMLPYKGHLRWAYTEWTSASQRTVREVIHRFFKKDDGAGTAETSHSLWNDVTGDAGREYHAVRAVYDQTAQYDRVWYFDGQRRLSIFDERKAGGITTVRKTFSWSITPVTSQPFIWQVDTTLEPWRGNAITRRSTQALDQYGNVTTSEEWDYGLNLATRKIYSMTYVTDANYTSRFIRNRLLQATLQVGTGPLTTLATNVYDTPGGAHPCGVRPANPLVPPGTPDVDPALAYLHDSSYQSAVYRGNLTSFSSVGNGGCQWHDYLGVLRARRDNAGTVTVNPDAAKSYAVPAGISANGYSSTLSWDSALNLTQVNAPNSASSVYGYDTAGRNTSATDPDGATSSAEYSVSGKVNVTASGKRRTWTYLDGIGRPVRVSTGYMPDNSTTGVVESSVDTEYELCACSPFGKVKRVSQPYAPGQEASRVWTVYDYDELGRVKTVTHPPNTGTSGNSGLTTYVYELNTVKVTDPANRWKKYEMDGFGNLVKVTEPKPVSGEYETTYVYSAVNELKTVTMTRDGFTGGTPATITQTRQFTYSGGRLQSTQLPEVPGTTTYAYNADGTLLSKTDYKGVRKYYYTTAKQLERVERYPGAVGQPEDLKGQVENFYNVIPAAAGTSFVGQNLQGRLAATKYNCNSLGLSCMWEFYSYTKGGC